MVELPKEALTQFWSQSINISLSINEALGINVSFAPGGANSQYALVEV